VKPPPRYAPKAPRRRNRRQPATESAARPSGDRTGEDGAIAGERGDVAADLSQGRGGVAAHRWIGSAQSGEPCRFLATTPGASMPAATAPSARRPERLLLEEAGHDGSNSAQGGTWARTAP
jgi:hypothetical protein